MLSHRLQTHQLKRTNFFFIVFILVLFTSVAVMIGWFIKFKPILEVIPGSATMKFNTAFLFFCSAISFYTLGNEAETRRTLNYISIGLLLIMSFYTMLSYVVKFPFSIDLLFVTDPYSKTLPGRMSLGTAVSFFLLGFALLGLQHNLVKLIKHVQKLLFIILMLASVSIVSFVLHLNSGEKTFFLQTMAIHTASLLFLLALGLSLKNKDVGYLKFITGNLAGNKMLAFTLPVAIILPIILGFVLIQLTNKAIVSVRFGIVVYCVFIMAFSLVYFTIVSVRLNKSDKTRRALEEKLQTNNLALNQFKTALEKIAIVVITDEKGVIKYVNDEFCRVSEYDRNEIIGKTHNIINSGHHSDTFFKTMWKTISSGNIWVKDIKNRTKSGKTFWVNTAIIPILDTNGQPHEFISIKIDITVRKENQRELKSKYVNQLEKNNHELEQFAYVASHDLQEPLKTIMSFSDLLHDEYYDALDDTGKDSLNFIKASTLRMQTLIKGLLDYSRLGKEYNLEPVDLNVLVQQCTCDLKTKIDKTGAKIKVQHTLPIVNGYSLPLKLLFQNLITNAIKFVAPNTIPTVKIACKETTNFWEIYVCDNGIGIAKEHQKRIFDIFQRLHAKSEYEGTGIGLAHCLRIAELHKGEIEVVSEKDKGSTFKVKLKKQVV